MKVKLKVTVPLVQKRADGSLGNGGWVEKSEDILKNI